MKYIVTSDQHSGHGLPVGAVVEQTEGPDWSSGAEWFTQGSEGDEVAIDPRDLREA